MTVSESAVTTAAEGGRLDKELLLLRVLWLLWLLWLETLKGDDGGVCSTPFDGVHNVYLYRVFIAEFIAVFIA